MSPGTQVLALGDPQWMDSYGWAILALLGAITFSLYFWSYLRKSFEVWKTKDNKYFDSEVLEYCQRMCKAFIIMLMAVLTLLVVSLVLGWEQYPSWFELMKYVFDAVFISIVILVSLLIVNILRRVARRSRSVPSTGTALPSALEVTSIFLIYLVYIASIVIIILIIVSSVPEIDVFEYIMGFLSRNEGNLAVTAAILVGIFFVVKLAETLLEDFKYRSKKFNPQVIDLLKKGVKYAVYTVGALIFIFMIFIMIDMWLVGLILVSITMIFLVLGIVLSYSTIQNVVSGIALMDTSPFEVGDRVKLFGNTMCDVVEKGLVFTKVKTLEGDVVDIPNAEILTSKILNYSRSEVHGVAIVIGISYNIPFDLVQRVAQKAIDEVEEALKEPRPEIVALEVNGKNVQYEIEVFIKNVEAEKEVRSKIISKLQSSFTKEGFTSIFD
jgi:small conductance mechanosensitive channel